MTQPSDKLKKNVIERCGFCGSLFSSSGYLTLDEVNLLTKEELASIPLGYCPNAGYEDQNYQEERRVSKDMALDAGMPELEGQLL